MAEIIKQVKGLYKIIKFRAFRQTEGVVFDQVPMDMFDSIDSIDRVLHAKSAVSPGSVGDIKRPWYMHEFQEDNLIVLHGTRNVELYTPDHGRIEHFKVTPNAVYINGELIVEGSAMLVWATNVFHRIVSDSEGSASINFAVHRKGFDLKTNFNIYDVNTKTGKYTLLREGFKDQS